MVAEAVGGDVRAGIGMRLRAARERKALTILQAAEKIHTDTRVLEFLEAEDFAALGAPVYVRGHLRHYAELVGESPAELQEIYASTTRTVPPRPDLTQIPRAQPEKAASRMVGPTVLVLVVLAIIGTVGWLVSLSGGHAQPAAVVDTEAKPSADHPAAPPAQAHPSGAAPQAGPPSAMRAVSSSGTGPAAGAPTASASRVSAETTAPDGAAASAAGGASTAAAIPVHARAAELTLKFNSDSWAEVYDAAGQRLFYDVGSAGSAHTVKGPAPLRLVLGNAAGVALEFNGRPAAIPASTQPDGGVQFIINAHGRAVPAKPAADGE